MSVRVRSIISSLDTRAKKAFLQLLAVPLLPPDECKVPVKYPNAILTALPKESCYSMLGVLSEALLRYKTITIATLFLELDKIHPLTPAAKEKITKSKTTEPFLNHIVCTRTKLDEIAIGNLENNHTLQGKNVEGHPDMVTLTQLFEVKMTGRVEKNWGEFLLQGFSYAALSSVAIELYLVLPLQEQILSLQLSSWAPEKRAEWLRLLESHAVQSLLPDKPLIPLKPSGLSGQMIQYEFQIGSHMIKKKSLVETFQSLPADVPSQIFLGSPTSFRLNIADSELASASSKIGAKKVYVHASYLINLCKDGNRDELLVKNIEYAVLLGCKGVIVHVGKSTSRPLGVAIENMRKTLLDALACASVDCPLLLETPAGQGTETLTDRDLFLGFVLSFNDPRLAICVDTCHVFTCGHDPLEYLCKAHATGLLRLVHFNDSASQCGACVDRHAYIGTGHIGVEKMKEMAAFCAGVKIDMVIE